MKRRAAAIAVAVALALATAGWRLRAGRAPLRGATAVWATDDGWRVASADGALPAMQGGRPGAWRAGETIALFGLPGETLAFQVVVSAGDRAVDGATVAIAGSGPIELERFVVTELAMPRRSGGRDPRESLGWAAGAAPPVDGDAIPDPLVRIDHAPPWAEYPLRVAAGRHRVVWVDARVPEGTPAGTYRYEVQVDAGRRLATMPLAIEVGRTPLPYRAARTMVYFEPERVNKRVGADSAAFSLWRLLHAHELSAVTPIRSAADVRALRDALTGALFTAARGYRGPGAGVGSDVVVIGAYGVLRDPDDAKLAAVDAILGELAALGIEDRPGELDVFLYAADEHCESPRAAAWRRALSASASPRLRKLRVGQTCSRPAPSQGADIVMMHAGSWHGDGWIYNGMLPRTGSFLSDAWPLSLRANAWIQAWNGIGRWFYWESAFWDDDNDGGRGPYDPLAVAETFHNDDGDHCNGDGVLVYPGRQPAPWRDLGIDGVVPSIRLKQWRRGIQDAGYIALARAVDRAAADAVVRPLVGRALEPAPAPSWPTEPEPWLQARRALFDIIERR